jgi:hypothetical protein
MEFLPAVIEAEYRGEYMIRLTFNDGFEETIDFAQWLEGPCVRTAKGYCLLSAVLHRGRDCDMAQWSRHRPRDAAQVCEVKSGGVTAPRRTHQIRSTILSHSTIQ